MEYLGDKAFAVKSEHSKWKEEVQWLLENFGPIGERWDYNGGLFLFKNEKDKLIFLVALA